MENSNNKGVKVVGFWVSIFTHRVRWALGLKGIKYEYIEEDIYNKSPDLLSKLNPIYEKVPVLIHDGISMPESSIIIEYIDQIWSHNPLMPQDPYQRAEARFLAKFADEKVMIATWLALCSEGENQKRAIKLSIDNLKIVEEKLQGSKFFGGDTVGYLDLMMGYVAYILPIWEEVASVRILDPLKFPAIAAWSENFLSHPVIKTAYLPPKVEMLTYFRQLMLLLKRGSGAMSLSKFLWQKIMEVQYILWSHYVECVPCDTSLKTKKKLNFDFQ